MNSLTAGNQPPIVALGWRGVRQTREPGEWHRNRPAIGKVRAKRVVADPYGFCKCLAKLSSRSTHATTPIRQRLFPRPAFPRARFPPGQNRGSFPSEPAPARTSRSRPPAPRAHVEVLPDPPSRRRIDMGPREERWATLPVYTHRRQSSATRRRQRLWGNRPLDDPRRTAPGCRLNKSRISEIINPRLPRTTMTTDSSRRNFLVAGLSLPVAAMADAPASQAPPAKAPNPHRREPRRPATGRWARPGSRSRRSVTGA
jgi:hypothetical protein